MEKILHEINGIKYVLIEQVVVDENRKLVDRYAKHYNCICQGLKEAKRGFLYRSYAVFKILVPEQHIFEYQKAVEID